jgi:hypothetical protein
MLLSGCAGNWGVKYADAPEPQVTGKWRLARVNVSVPDTLSVSEDNTYAPNADIVWHGEDFGDRRKQVAAIVREGITKGARRLEGSIPVVLSARVIQFHAVTPAAVARAPGAVHNIKYDFQVFHAGTGEALTGSERISADLEAYVGSAAVIAAIQGDTQRVRIVRHLAAVTAGWLGIGDDQRHTFGGVGR